MLDKVTVIDQIQILEGGHVQVRRATYIVEDGVRLPHPQYHRVAYEPGADLKQEDPRVRALAAVAWTDGVVQAHHATTDMERIVDRA